MSCAGKFRAFQVTGKAGEVCETDGIDRGGAWGEDVMRGARCIEFSGTYF